MRLLHVHVPYMLLFTTGTGDGDVGDAHERPETNYWLPTTRTTRLLGSRNYTIPICRPSQRANGFCPKTGRRI